MANIKITISGPAGSGKAAIADQIEAGLRSIGVPVRYESEVRNRQTRGAPEKWREIILQNRPSVTILERVGEPTFPVVVAPPASPLLPGASPPPTPVVPNPYNNPFIAIRNKVGTLLRRKHAAPPA